MNEQIKQYCLELGFDAAGITTAEPVAAAQVDYFDQWLDDGCAGDMGYMARNIEKRFDPAKLLTGAKSVICVLLNYRPKSDELPVNPAMRIANFALYEDYHPFIKQRLFQLAEFIETKAWSDSDTTGNKTVAANGSGRMRIRFKACVDSAPLAERALAQRAGLGFFGKNHMLIHPELGCQTLLGELITTVELEPDAPPPAQSCGNCGKCIRACPTGALDFDGGFDARKCISYLTIESKEPIPTEYRGKLGNRIFGCDACITACPHEMHKPPRTNPDIQLHPEWQNLKPNDIASMTEAQFAETFANSGLIRTGLSKLKQTIANIGLDGTPKESLQN